MAIIKTNDRLEVIEAIINTWLKDKTIYCNNCGVNYSGNICCEDPQVGTNMDHARALSIENEMVRSNQLKNTGASKKNTMRLSLRLPPRLYQFIRNYFLGYNENFPKDKRELHRLMRRLKAFCIPREI